MYFYFYNTVLVEMLNWWEEGINNYCFSDILVKLTNSWIDYRMELKHNVNHIVSADWQSHSVINASLLSTVSRQFQQINNHNNVYLSKYTNPADSKITNEIKQLKYKTLDTKVILSTTTTI